MKRTHAHATHEEVPVSDRSSRIPVVALLSAVALLFAGVLPSRAGSPVDLERNKTLVVEALAALDAGALDDLDRFHAADYVRHSQATPDAVVENLEDFKALPSVWGDTYSDIESTLDMLVAEGDRVAFYGSFRATQTGSMGPFPATGKRMVSEFAGYHRIAGGKIAETWVTWDNLAVLAQLGLFPSPGPEPAPPE